MGRALVRAFLQQGIRDHCTLYRLSSSFPLGIPAHRIMISTRRTDSAIGPIHSCFDNSRVDPYS